LTKIEGLEELHNLEEIYMSHNAIEKIEGFEHNVSAFLIITQTVTNLYGSLN
jgi:hypothetical protein